MASLRYLHLNKSLSSSSSTGSEMTAPFSTTDITMASHSSECKSKGRQAFSQTSRVNKDLTIAPLTSMCSFRDSHKIQYDRDKTTDMELYTQRSLETNCGTLVSGSKKNESSSSESSEIMTHVKRSGVHSEKLPSRRQAWPDRGTEREVNHESKSESKIEYFTSWIKNNPDENLEEQIIRRYAWQDDETSTCHSFEPPLSGRQKNNFCDELNIEDLEDRLTLFPKKESDLTKVNHRCEGSLLKKLYALESGKSFPRLRDRRDIVPMHRNTVVLPPLSESSNILGKEDRETSFFLSMAEPFTLDSSKSPNGIPERIPWPKKLNKALRDRWRDVAITLPSVKGTHKRRKIPRIPHEMNQHAYVPFIPLKKPECHGDGVGRNRDDEDQGFDRSDSAEAEETIGSGKTVRQVKRENSLKQNRDDGISIDSRNRETTSAYEIGGINDEKRNYSETNVSPEDISTNQKERFMLSCLIIPDKSKESNSNKVNLDDEITASDASKVSLSESQPHVSETFPTSGTDEVSENSNEKGDNLSTFLSHCSHVEKKECDSLDPFLDKINKGDCVKLEPKGSSECFREYEVPQSNGRTQDEAQCQNKILNNQQRDTRDLGIVSSADNASCMDKSIHSSNTTASAQKSDQKCQIVSKESNPLANSKSTSNYENYEMVSLSLDPKLNNLMSLNAEERGNEYVSFKNGGNRYVYQDNSTNNEHSQTSHCVSHLHAFENILCISLPNLNFDSTLIETKQISNHPTSFTSEEDEGMKIDDKSKNEPTLKSELYCEKTISLEELSAKEDFTKLPDVYNLTYPHNIHDDNSAYSEPNCTHHNSKANILESKIEIIPQSDQGKEIVNKSKNELTLNCELYNEETICLAEQSINVFIKNTDFHNLTHPHNIHEVTDSTYSEINSTDDAQVDHLEQQVTFMQHDYQGKETVYESKNELNLKGELYCDKIISLTEQSSKEVLIKSLDSHTLTNSLNTNDFENCPHRVSNSTSNNSNVHHSAKPIDFIQQQDQGKEIIDETKTELILTNNLHHEKISLREGAENESTTNSQYSNIHFQPHSIKEVENMSNRALDCKCIPNEWDRISNGRISFMQALDQKKERVDESKSEPTVSCKFNCEKTISLEETTLCKTCKEYRPLQKQLSNECIDPEITKEYSDSKIIAKKCCVSRKRAISSSTTSSHTFKRSKTEIATTTSFSSEQNINLFRNSDSHIRIKAKRSLRSRKVETFAKEKLKSSSISEPASTTAMESEERTESDLTPSSLNRDTTSQSLQKREESIRSEEHQNDLLDTNFHSQLSEQNQQGDDEGQISSCRRSGTRRSSSTQQEDFETSHNSEGNLGQESNGWETLECESVNFESVKNVSEWLEKSQSDEPQDMSIKINYSSGVQVSANRSSKATEDPSSVGCTTTSRSTFSDSANEDDSNVTRDVVVFASSDSVCERRRAMEGGGDDRVSTETRSDDRKRRRSWRATEGRRKVLKRRRKKLVARERSARCRRVLPPPQISAPPPSPRRRRHPVFSLPSAAAPLFERLATSSESVSSLRMLDGSRKFSRRNLRRYLGRGDFLFKDPGSSENSLNKRPSFDKNSLLVGSGKEHTWKTSGDSSESCQCACDIRKQNLFSSSHNPHASMLPASPELTMLNELKSRKYIRSSARKRGSQTASKSFSEFQTIKKHQAANPKPSGAYFVPVPIIQTRGAWTRRSSPVLTPAGARCSSSKMHPDGFVSHVEGGHVMAPPLVPVMPMAMALPQFVMPLPWQETAPPPSASCRSPVRTDWLAQGHTLSRTGPTVLHFVCLQPMAGKQRK